MNKAKYISIIAIGLLLANIGLVAYILLQKPHHPPHHKGGGGPRNIIIEKLKLDEAQVKEYDNLIKWHRSEIDKKEGEIKHVKGELYQVNTKEGAVQQRDSLIQVLGNLQQDIERIHCKHFSDIEAMCKAEQRQYFIDLTKEMADLFGHRVPPKQPPHGEGPAH